MFYLVCEGGEHTLAYMQAHGVTPDIVAFDLFAFRERIAYLGSDDAVLVLIHGLTDFTWSGLAVVLQELALNKAVGLSHVLSDIPLLVKDIDYVQYSGDLFENKEVKKRKHSSVGEVLSAFSVYKTEKSAVLLTRNVVSSGIDVDEQRARMVEVFDTVSPLVHRVLPKLRGA